MTHTWELLNVSCYRARNLSHWLFAAEHVASKKNVRAMEEPLEISELDISCKCIRTNMQQQLLKRFS